MFKKTALFKKFFLTALVLAIALSAFSVTGASAAGLNSQANAQPNYPRIQKIWAREQALYQREGRALTNASTFIARVQTLLDKGYDSQRIADELEIAESEAEDVIEYLRRRHDEGI